MRGASHHEHNGQHTLTTFLEADADHGPVFLMAYAYCLLQELNLHLGMHQQKLALQSSHWLLYYYNPLWIDSMEPGILLRDYVYTENHYKSVTNLDPNLLLKRPSRMSRRAGSCTSTWRKIDHHITRP